MKSFMGISDRLPKGNKYNGRLLVTCNIQEKIMQTNVNFHLRQM